MTTTTSQQLASDLASAFVTDTRDDGKEFYKLSDEAAGWMTSAVHAAHGDMMPNDWVYEQCSRMADRLADCEPERWEDSVSEWADSLVDVYNADRSAWLASHLDFAGWVDEAVDDMGHSDQGIFGDIGLGQYRFLEQIGYALVQAIREEVASDEDEGDEE